MADARYGRVLLKISGEALMGDEAYGIDPVTVSRIAAQIKASSDLGTQIAVVRRLNFQAFASQVLG